MIYVKERERERERERKKKKRERERDPKEDLSILTGRRCRGWQWKGVKIEDCNVNEFDSAKNSNR